MTNIDNTNEGPYVQKLDPRNGIVLKKTPALTDAVLGIDSQAGNVLKYFQVDSLVNSKVLINTELEAATQNVDLTGFSSRCCELLFNLKNDNVGAATYSVYINGDTNAANYHRNQIYAVNGGAPTGGEGANPIIESPIAAGLTMMGKVIIMTGPGYLMMDVITHGVNDPANHGTRIQNILYHGGTVTDITSIRLAASVANAIGVGSNIRLVELG